jgi:ion channel-forming bestrophin family protein
MTPFHRKTAARYLDNGENCPYARSMIVRDHLPLRRVWPDISKRLGALLLIDLTVSVLYSCYDVKFLGLPHLPLAIMGGALSVFLAFRNNSAYDRWWEARTLWGGLVNNTRTIARQALTLATGRNSQNEETIPEAKELVELTITYIHALRCHLRKQNPFPELEQRLDSEAVRWLRTHNNVPAALLLRMGEVTKKMFEQGYLDTMRFTAIDRSISELCNLQGACERIKNTPLPRQYEYFPRLLVGAYCLLLPFGLVSGMGLFTPLASTVVSFIFVSLESIGRDIEAPFDNTVHDTPMSSLSRMIEINLRQSLSQQPAFRELTPVDGFVY